MDFHLNKRNVIINFRKKVFIHLMLFKLIRFLYNYVISSLQLCCLINYTTYGRNNALNI